MPRDYSKPFKQVGEIERVYSGASGKCERHGIPEPCIICIDNRKRDLFADELLSKETSK